MQQAVSDLPYRPCVGIMLVNAGKQVFTARRIDLPGPHWQMPQGGIDEGESPEQAALRELEEEIGTAKADIVEAVPDWLYYDLPSELAGKIWGGKYRGQKQRWFLMRFTGEDADINIDTEYPEFLEWRWQSVASLPETIVPFKRDIYQQLVYHFQPIINTL